MPNVTIEWLEGRTLEQRREVIAGITDLADLHEKLASPARAARPFRSHSAR